MKNSTDPESILIEGLRILRELRKQAGCDVLAQAYSNISEINPDYSVEGTFQKPAADYDCQWQSLLRLLSPQ